MDRLFMGGDSYKLLIASFVVMPALAACDTHERSKPVDLKAVSACMAAQHSNDDYLLAIRCEPLTPQKEITGTWFVGFELSLFRKGYIHLPAQIGTADDHPYQLVVPTALQKLVHVKDAGGTAAYQLSFVGRESLLNSTPDRRLIVLDRVTSMRPVEMK